MRAATAFDKRRLIVGAAGLLLVLYLLPAADEAVPVTRYHLAMDTLVKIDLFVDEAGSERFFELAITEIDRIDSLMSHYSPHSEVSGVNDRAAEAPVAIAADLSRVLERSIFFSRRTQGAFDVTLGALTDLWNFPEARVVPAKSAIDSALAVSGYQHLRLEGGRIHFAVDGLRLDLSASAKGYAVDRAIEIHETLAREDPKRPGRLANLLAVALIRVGEPGGTERLRTRLDAELKKRPNDLVARFLLGVLHHYRNEFDRSNALLGPLERTLGGEPRFHVYLAMNDFNLGRRAPALDRLNRAMKLSTIDPDVYYCRAEILRDSDRPQALADLRLYATMSTASALHNKEKEQKVRRMIASLEACEKAGTGVCPGPWEHPRATMQKHEGAP